MFKKIFSLFAALTLSVGLFAKTSVITYTATEKLPETTSGGSGGLHTNAFYAADSTQLTITEHSFNEGVGTITFNGEVAILGEYAFKFSTFTSITLPEGVTTIGERAFRNCDSLLSVTLPEGVTMIKEEAFCACDSLRSITIPASVTTIEGAVFQYSDSLQSITFLGNACQEGIDEYAFDGVGATTPATLVLPDNWTGTKPDEDGNWYGGKFTLAAPAKTSVITYTATEKLPETTETRDTKGLHLNAFYAADNTQLTVTHTFNEGVGTITLNGEVTIIGNFAFYQCGSLVSVTLPESVTTIGMGAFFNCDALQSITIPASVTEIGYRAFYGCFALASVTFESNACQNGIGEEAFLEVGKDAPALLTLPDSWTGSKPDEEGNWYGGKFKLNDTALPTLFGANGDATKFLYNGQVIIRQGDKTYNTLGQEVK